jgi:hypothetical protein
MPLPNLIVIGAMKCGTTSLHFQLRRHPEIVMPRDKEIEFFIAERNWGKGVAWYASRFPAGTRIRGESSPNYTAMRRFPGVPARMHSVVPDVRLVYMVRDPLERLISHWVSNRADEGEARPLAEAALDDRYLDRSLYWKQISAYLAYYPRSRVLVIAMEDLAEERAATLRKVFEFLKVDPAVTPRDFRLNRSKHKRVKNRAGAWIERSPLGRSVETLPSWLGSPAKRALYRPLSRRIVRPAFSERERDALVERLREDTNRFREFTGREFAEWSV